MTLPASRTTNIETNEPPCPKCGSDEVVYRRVATMHTGEVYFYECELCEHQWGHS